jgi:hypothetical protein
MAISAEITVPGKSCSGVRTERERQANSQQPSRDSDLGQERIQRNKFGRGCPHSDKGMKDR